VAPKAPKQRRGLTVLAGLVLVTGVGALVFRDEVRHTIVGAERCGRVAITLGLNIREYAYHCGLNVLQTCC
jgi:hypothetical protein